MSTIDHIVVPACLIETPSFGCRGQVWDRKGRKLQCARTYFRVDHVPVACAMKINTLSLIPRVTNSYDRDKLSLCLMKGVGRHRFLKNLEKHIEENLEEWEAAKVAKSPTLQYEFLRKNMVKTLEETFPKNEAQDSAEIIALRKERVRLLGERRQFMGANVCHSKHSNIIKHYFHRWRVGGRLIVFRKSSKKSSIVIISIVFISTMRSWIMPWIRTTLLKHGDSRDVSAMPSRVPEGTSFTFLGVMSRLSSSMTDMLRLRTWVVGVALGLRKSF